VLTALTLLKQKQSGRSLVPADDTATTAQIPTTIYGYGVDGGIRHLYTKCILDVHYQMNRNLGIGALAMSVLNDMTTHLVLELLHLAYQWKKRDATSIGEEDAEITSYEEDEQVVDYDESNEERDLRERDEFFQTPLVMGIAYGQTTRVLEDTRHLDDPHLEVQFYFDFEDVPDGAANRDEYFYENEQMQMITIKAIEESCRSLFPDRTFKSAKKEGSKAVYRFNRNSESFEWEADVGNGDESEISSMSGIHLIPEYILLLSKVCATAPKHIVLQAAIYLSAVVEDLLAMVLEEAGSIAKDLKQQELSTRHLFLAIQNYDDLKAVFPGVVRGGGVNSFIPHNIIPDLTKYPLEFPPGAEILLNQFAEDVKSNGPRVHPLTGDYTMWCNDSDVGAIVGYNGDGVPIYRADLLPPSLVSLKSCSLLNAMSFADSDERQGVALNCCDDDERAKWQAILTHPRLAWTCRLYEVIQAQEDSLPIFKTDLVWSYACELLQDFICDMDLTFEAGLLFRTVVESFLVETARKASKILENDGRIVLKTSDWQLALQF
jgi:histone H3/H4